MQGELMAPSGGDTLSAITVQSMADLGYGVDVSQADAYSLLGVAGSSIRIRERCEAEAIRVTVRPEQGT